MCKQSDQVDRNRQNIENKVWLKEPNEIFETYRGYTFLVRRQYLGYLCGYVLLEKGAPYYGKSAEWVNLDVHGQIDYAEPFSGLGYGESDIWAIGFHCSHCFDYVPFSYQNKLAGTEQLILEGIQDSFNSGGVYRTYEYVRRECIDVINQLSAKDTRGKQTL